jgi:serine/threonine-protein kinase
MSANRQQVKPAKDAVTDLSDAATLLYGGRYELIDLVGAGGAGTVYRARDVELDEIVALKVLRKELLGSGTILENFRSEVKLARRVTHRNVARMFDIGEQDGERFLTMEFVEGELLTGKINSGPEGSPRPLPLPLVQDIIDQVCAGLTAAHAVGIIHRDLKPDNIIIGRDNRVVITDFGIARALKSEGANQSEGEFVGTPEYMSPEQAEGNPVDVRTDVYSLGVVLFEMLTGALPFVGTNPLVTAAARLLRPPPDPRNKRPGLPEALAQVILRAMSRQAHDRYATAADLARAVSEAVQSVTGSFEAVSAPSGGRSLTGAAPIVVNGTGLTLSGQIEKRDSTPTISSSLNPKSDGAAQRSIVVLPFRNQGPAEDAYLAEGLTDDLIDALSMLPSLRVRSRGAVLAQLRQLNKDVPDPTEVGRALGAELLVDGSVRRAGNALRIAARLLTSSDGTQLWAQRFDRPAADALLVSDEVAQAVAGAVLSGQSVPQRTVLKDAEAVDLYLRARTLYYQGGMDNQQQAIHLYEQALSLRPDDPMLLSAYAMSRAKLWFFGVSGQGELARQAAERAIAVAPDRADSQLAMAMVCFYHGDAAGALRHARETIQRAQNNAEAYDLIGRVLAETGPGNSALRYLERAFELDSVAALRTVLDRVRVKALQGEWNEVEPLLEHAERNGLPANATWIIRARFAGWQADPVAAARRLIQHPYVQSGQNPRIRSLLNVIAGDTKEDFEKIFFPNLSSDQSSPRSRSFFHQLQTEAFMTRKQPDAAIRALARSVDAGLFDWMWLDRCPLLNDLRRDLRFQALRKIVIERATRIQNVLRT